MSRDRIECPLCDMVRFEPMTSTRSVSWSADCACSDAGRCAYHNYNPEDAPYRPSKAELLARAERYNESQKQDFQELKKKVDSYHSLMEEVETLRASLDDANRRLDGFMVASKMAQELVAKRQREACAKEAEGVDCRGHGMDADEVGTRDACVDAVRATPLVTEEDQ